MCSVSAQDELFIAPLNLSGTEETIPSSANWRSCDRNRRERNLGRGLHDFCIILVRGFNGLIPWGIRRMSLILTRHALEKLEEIISEELLDSGAELVVVADFSGNLILRVRISRDGGHLLPGGPVSTPFCPHCRKAKLIARKTSPSCSTRG